MLMFFLMVISILNIFINCLPKAAKNVLLRCCMQITRSAIFSIYMQSENYASDMEQCFMQIPYRHLVISTFVCVTHLFILLQVQDINFTDLKVWDYCT